MKWPVVVACLALLLESPSARALQQPPAVKGGIEGVVVRAGTSQGIPLARVMVTWITSSRTISAMTTANSSIVTDSQGRFAFRDLDPSAYRVSASANGYAKQEYGQRTFGGQGTAVNVNSGQTIRDLVISLSPAGTVSGRIRDNSGQPVTGIQVQLLSAVYSSNGARTFQVSGSARSDDLGQYRLYWITPGRYYLLATGGGRYAPPGSTVGSPNESLVDAIAPTFYPGTGDIAQAGVIDLKSGAELGGVDIFVIRQTPYRIRGRVIDGRSGQVPGGATVSVITNSFPGSTYSTISSQTNSADGSFDIRVVSPGPHFIRAQVSTSSNVVTPANSGAVLSMGSVTVPISVTSDVDGLVLTLASPASLSGRFSVEGSPIGNAAAVNQLRAQLKPSLDGFVTAGVGGPTPTTQATNADGSFHIDTVLPGEYRLSFLNLTSLPPDTFIKQALFNQSDVLNNPMQFAGSETGTLDIVLSSQGGQIAGTVSDDGQHPASGIQAVLVPDRVRDRIDLYKTATTDAAGRFTLRGIAPGDYRVFAWEAIDPYAYFDPDLIEQYELRGKAVHVSEASKENVDVRMIPVEP